jgi:arabinofuranan 3-O-arabinosyltransferase
MSSKPTVPDWLFDALDPARIISFLLRARVRWAIAWIVAVACSFGALHFAWTAYDTAERADGNRGHVFVDFSGQWIMGRILVAGRGRDLYHKDAQHELIEEAYRDDAPHVEGWLRPADDGRPGVRGPLYPPINAILFAPLGLVSPQPAYRVVQVVNFLLTFLVGLLVHRLTSGRIWAPVAVVAVISFPGFNGTVCLAQNPLLSLAILLAGWTEIARGRQWAGGVLWGLLAFKPVWAAAFFLVPLFSGRWRVCLAMLVTGAVLAALTLPLVGWQSWFDWLAVARGASELYARDEKWIFLSRDLQNVPRRWLLHFDDGGVGPIPFYVDPLCLGLLAGVVAVTAAVAVWRRRDPAAVDGPPAAFLCLGAWLSCLHFMYYDVLLAGLGVVLLFSHPRRYLPPIPVGPFAPPEGWGVRRFFLAAVSPAVNLIRGPSGTLSPQRVSSSNPMPLLDVPAIGTARLLGHTGGWVGYAFVPVVTLLLFALPHIADCCDYFFFGRTEHYPPFDTFCVLALWLWCGWTWLRTPAPIPS